MRDLILFLTLFAAAATLAAPADTDPAKQLVVDGSMVHDVGRLHLNITNFGLIGSHYSNNTTYSHAPSGRWPGAEGPNHLYAAGLWIGGVQLGERRVSTGQYETEIRATLEPEDIIYATAWDAPQASRYPFPDPDDDADGLEDEDPPNGHDDDQDGLIDEDGAGIGDQHFRAEMFDIFATDYFPDHVPLNLAIRQESFQWSADEVADIVGFAYTIRNIGTEPVTELFLGLFSDFDIADPEDNPFEAADDMVGFAAATVEAYPGKLVDVEVAYAYEGIGASTSGYMGWLPVGHPTDPDGVAAPAAVQVRGFQRFAGQLPFDQGGDPTNDGERYEALAAAAFDDDSAYPDDYRNLISVGPFAGLAVGEELTVAFALVAGADLDEMLRNAGRARLLYEGMAFDRDGDPANGAEFVVRWLGPEELAVSVEQPPAEDDDTPALAATTLRAAPNPFNPTLAIEAALRQPGPVRLSILDVRGREIRVLHHGSLAAGTARWRWDGRDAGGRQAASGVYLVRLATADLVTQRAVTLVK
jgi:hypothetical protein